MNTTTHTPRRAAAIVAACTLAAAGLGAAAPASAATIDGAPVGPSPDWIAPANKSITIDLEAPVGDTMRPVLPAGTYWIHQTAQRPVFDFWIEGLSERFEPVAQRWSRVVLTEPGPITATIPDVGAPGTINSVLLYPMPAGSPDPAALSPEEIDAALTAGLDGSGVSDPLDHALVWAANVDAISLFPGNLNMPPQPPGAEDGPIMWGDFLNLGVDLPLYRSGNRFTVLGPNAEMTTMSFGRATDEWFVGDWDGDGRPTVGLRRGNQIFLDNSVTGGHADVSFAFGRPGDEVLVGDFDGDGTDTIALRRGTTFYVSNSHGGGVAPISFAYGHAGDIPLVDDWDQNGTDTIAVFRDMKLLVKNSLAGGAADAVLDAGGE